VLSLEMYRAALQVPSAGHRLLASEL
jgi:hypothetical protein